MTVPAELKAFVKAYNDTKKYPTLADLAAGLNLSHQTVRNKSSVYRARTRLDDTLPKLIDRKQVEVIAKRDEKTPEQHAHARALDLAQQIEVLTTSSNFPLINPSCIQVESFMTRKWDRDAFAYVPKESTPRTWLNATPLVAPIADPRGRRFIFTGAQNDTEVHKGFWTNLKAYAKAIGAEIAVGPGTYETQWWSENNPAARAYDPVLKDHLCFGQLEIGPSFMFCGQMNIIPTASKPIDDLIANSRGKWAVFPHSKRQLRSVPSTDPDVQAVQVMSTGLVTRPKVIPRKAGIKSLFHHVLGAVVVEFDQDGDVFCRHISASREGAFYDLDAYVTDGKVIRGKHRARALTTPDSHRAKMGPTNARAIWGWDPLTGKTAREILPEWKDRKSLVDVLNPEEMTYHDFFDNEYRNHHHADDPLHNYEQAFRGKDRVGDEAAEAFDFLIQTKRKGTKSVVIEANHDLALNRYVIEGRFRMDGINARLGNQLESDLLDRQEVIARCRDAYQKTPNWSLLETLGRRMRGAAMDGIYWAYDGKSYKIDGIEHGHHGFRGANGAKGTVLGFAKLGIKITIGDKHSPQIEDGVYVAGALELNHGYNKGPSSWAVACVVQYPDGKRAIITLQNGKFRG
ncbi:hypothetical protein IVB12_16140 [Bradyrhizobium sp. 179]|uniref:hypothetical protein n=1 Tax=Bradyrhizobium sp. 179 TaxID=2782648 RepID=UPI001FF88860|nr:hypothetical protein [Bradyrhizobium sp. 179]MCK1543448.1 hypothetical protein [Bradyrhizobium sp. 179]